MTKSPLNEKPQRFAKAGEIRVEQRIGHARAGPDSTAPKTRAEPSLARRSTRSRARSAPPELHGHIEVPAHPCEPRDQLQRRHGSPRSLPRRLGSKDSDRHAQATRGDSEIVDSILIAGERLGQGTTELAHPVAEQSLRETSFWGGRASFGHGPFTTARIQTITPS